MRARSSFSVVVASSLVVVRFASTLFRKNKKMKISLSRLFLALSASIQHREVHISSRCVA